MTCERCGWENRLENAFCEGCGSVLERASAHRRQITVMFCDLVGSTELSVRLDPEDLRELIAAYHDICNEVVSQHDGHTAQYLGDGVLVYFGYPSAHEDDPARALRAALAIQELLRARRGDFERRWGFSVEARIGVHTGLVVVGEVGASGRREALALGGATNLASRLESEATKGGILASDTTVRLSNWPFVTSPREPIRLRGFPDPILAHDVHGEGRGTPSRFEVSGHLMPLVGRDQEVRTLMAALRHAASGSGGLVLVTGEPGIGKSRLLAELPNVGRGLGELRTLTLQCVDRDSTRSFGPVIDALRGVLSEEDEAPDPTTLLRALEFMGADAIIGTELLASHFGIEISPDLTAAWPYELRRLRTIETMADLALEQLGAGTGLLIVEDLQWADASTIEFVRAARDRAGNAKRLIVASARPEFGPEALEAADELQHIQLERLTASETGALVVHLAGDRKVPRELLDKIAERSDGNPLFAHQVSLDLMRHGEAPSLRNSTVPATLTDLLASRLDSLGSAREVAQRLAILGRDFPAQWTPVVCTGVDDLERKLDRIEHSGLLSRNKGRMRFSHMLIQDAAYQSLLRRDRRRLHARCAEAFEAGLDDVAKDQPGLIAHHWSEAGEAQRATDAWIRVARHEQRRMGAREAAAAIDRGLEHVDGIDDARARNPRMVGLFIESSKLTYLDGNLPDGFDERFKSAREAARESEPAVNAFFHMTASTMYLRRGELNEAAEAGDSALEACRGYDTEPYAHTTLARLSLYRGEIDSVISHSLEAEALYPAEIQHIGGPAMATVTVDGANYRAIAHWLSGFPDRALEQSRLALRMAEQIQEPTGSRAWSHVISAWLHLHLGKSKEALALAGSGLEIAIQTLNEHSRVDCEQMIRWIRCDLHGTASEARELVRHTRADCAAGRRLMASYGLTLAGLTLGRVGEPAHGLDLIEEAREDAERRSEKFAYPEILRARVVLGIVMGQPIDIAIDELTAALELADSLKMRSWSLRIAMDIATLRARLQDAEGATALLARVLAGFDEGHGTRDLVEARATLERLRTGRAQLR